MKVLYVFNDASEFACKFYVNEFRELQKLGWQIDLACNYDQEVPYITTSYPMPWNRNPFKFSTFQGIKKVRKLIETNGYDIVYCSSPIGGLIGRLAVKKVRDYHPGVIYFCHGFHFYKGCNPLRWVIFYPVEKWLSRYTDVLATINQEDYSLARKKMFQKQIVFSHGIGADFTKYLSFLPSENQKVMLKKSLGISDNVPVLFYSAEISKLKNQVYLLRVLKMLKSRGYSPVLLLAGRDRTKGKFFKKATKMGLVSNIRMLGFRNDCPALLSVCDFCTPSSTREGLGLNLVEAMCAGIPVIATENRGHREVIVSGHNGYLVSLKKPKDMVVRIEYCMDHQKELSNIVEEAKKDCLKYSFSEVFPGILQMYNDTILYKSGAKK